MLVLTQEVQKLCAYQGEGEIAAAALEKLSIRQLDANVFDLARRILGKNLSGALENLQELLDMGSEPVAVLGARCISLLAETDYQLKSSRTDPQILMQEAVVRLFLTLHRQGEAV